MEEFGNMEEFSENLPSEIISCDSKDETRTDDRNMTGKVAGDINSSADLGLPVYVPVTKDDDVEESTEVDNRKEVDIRNPLSPELQQGFRILKELMADGNKSVNWHFLEAVDSSHPETADYYERIKRPVWLGKMLSKFEDREYETITEFVSDFRLMLENCYRYNGPDHYVSKRGQKLETMMEQKLALLSRELREKTSIAATSGQNGDDNISFSGLRRRTRTIIPHDSSALLSQLREEELRRDREQRKQQITDRKAVQEAQLQGILDWETSLLDSKGDYMRAMWELPQIGHFLFLCQDALNIGEIPQFELERCFYMPRESVVMQKIMTALLSTPFQRMKIDKKTLMPYSIWDEKLRLRLRQWYKTFVDSHEDIQKTAVKLGIDVHFFDIVGKRNPLERRKFHDLCPYRRVWIVKSLCDYCLEHQESIRDAIECQPIEEQHDYLLGVDAEGTRYLHFPQFCGADLRIYKQKKIPEPKFPVLETSKQEEKEPKPMETDAETNKTQSSKKKKKKKKKLKPELPVPPTNRPSRLRQKIKTVLPVQNYSSSSPSSSDDEEDVCDESDGSDANTRTSFGDQSDLNLNDSGICDGTPKKGPIERPNKPLQRLMESDNCSDTSSLDGEGTCKRSRTRRLVRNGLLREFNVSEQSLDESSMDRDEVLEAKDETLSETSNTLDSLEDSNGACKNSNIKAEGKHIQDRNETEMCESDTDSQVLYPVSIKETNDISGCEPMDVSETEFQDVCEPMDAKGDHPKDIKPTDVKQSLFCDSLSAPNPELPSDDSGTSQFLNVPQNSVLMAEQSTCIDNIQDGSQHPLSECNIKPESNTPTSNPPGTVCKVKHEVCGVKPTSPLSSEKSLTQSDRDSSETSMPSCDKSDTSDIKIKVEMTEKNPEQGLEQMHDHDYSGQSGVGKFLDHDYGQSCHADLNRVTGKAIDSTKDKTEIKEEVEALEEVFPEIGPFKLIVECVEDLKQLVESFAEQEPIVIGKGKKQKVIKPPPRRRCVIDLHGRLLFLLKELEPWEQKLTQATRKARLKMHKEQTTYVEEQMEEKWESEHSESSGTEDGENSDTNGSEDEDKNEDRDVVSQQRTTLAAVLTIPQNETKDDCDDIDVSSRGRIRKRRVIPNNSEDPGTPKKRKLVNVSLATAVPHVPNILQRPGKTLSSFGPVDSCSAGQILLQTSSGNHTLLTGLPSNVKLVSGDKMFQPQAMSLLQRPGELTQHSQSLSHARLLQSQHTLSSKQASHPVIQQLLSTSRHPSPKVGLSSSHPVVPSSTPQRTVLFQPGNKHTNIRPAITKLATPGLSVVGGAVDAQLPNMASAGGKIQYYAANINTLPPSVLQQLIKSNALKIPPGPNQSGMVLLTTVNPQGPTSSSQSQTIAGLQIQAAQKSQVRTVADQTPDGLSQPLVPKTRLPVCTQVSSAAAPTPVSSVKHIVPQINTAVNIQMNVPSTISSSGHLQNVLSASTGGIVMTPSQTESTFTLRGVPNTNIEGSSGSVENVGEGNGGGTSTVGKPPLASNSCSLSPTNISSTSPNRQPYKYANNVTVKTLLEARKDAEKIPGESTKPILVKKTSEITSSTPTVLLHPTSTGIKTLKIPSKAALDSAVQAVVTDVPTSLPTVNIKVPAPSAMPAIQPRYNVTKTIQSMKGPIPTAPRLDPTAMSGNTSVNVTSPSPSQTNQSLLTQLQVGNNQIMLTTLNKSNELGNMVLAAAQQPQDKKNMTIKVLPHGVQQSQQGVMQGYLTPQGLIIPQAALQQQANDTQLINQGKLSNQTITHSILKTQSPTLVHNQLTQSILKTQSSTPVNNQTITHSILKTQSPTPGINQTITPGINQNLASGALQTISPGMNLTSGALQTISPGMNLTSGGLQTISPGINLTSGALQTITPGINQNLASGALQTISPGTVGCLSSMPVQEGLKGGSVTVSGNQLSHNTTKPRKTLQSKVVLPVSAVQSNYGPSPSSLIQGMAGTQDKTLITAGVPSQAGNLLAGLVRSGGSDTIGTKSVSSIINTTPVLSTSVISSASVKPSVSNDKSPSSVVDSQKVRLQAMGGGASTLLDLGGITKLQAQGQGLLMPGLIQGMNFVNIGGQLKLQEGGNNATLVGNNSINLSNMVSSIVSTGVSTPSLVSSSNTLGHIFPVVTLAGSAGSSGGQASPMVPPSPGPKSPLQLNSPLLGQLASSVGNYTVLGQIANPLNKTGVIGQTALAGNLQLLGQPGVKVTGSSSQILRLQNQQINIPCTSPSVIGQQLCLSSSSSQMIGQQLTSPVANQAPVVLGNIGQGSSSDLIKQLAAAQLQLSAQSSSPLVSQIPNQMVLQVPASPGVKNQAMIRPPGQQNLQAGQTMLLLSPQKRLQVASSGTGTQQPKQLTLRLNSPVLQQTQIKVPIVSSAKSTQDQNAMQLSKVKLNFDLQAGNMKPCQANVSKTMLQNLQTPVMGSAVGTPQATEKSFLPGTNPLHQKFGVVKTSTTATGTVQQANVVRFNTAASQVRLPTQQSVVMSLPDTIASPSTGPLLSPAKATTPQAGGSQKLFLYNIGGQLVTPQGVPVTVDNGVLKVLLPQTKTVSPPSSLGEKSAITPPVTIVSGADVVSYVTKPVYGTSSAIGSLTANAVRSNNVSSVTSIPGSILTNQSTKVNPSVGKVLPSGSAINASPSVVCVSTRSTKGTVSSSFVTASVVSRHSIVNTPQSLKSATVNEAASVLSQQLGSTSGTLSGNEHIRSPALTTGKTTTDNVGLVASNLKINQLLGQQGNVQDIMVTLTSPSSVPGTVSAPNNKTTETTNLKAFHVQNDNRPQIAYPPNISSLIGSGQGYIVMPGTTKKTQIIFPQQGQQNSPSNMDNVKVLKTQNIAELLKSPKIPQAAFVQQGAVSVASQDIEPVQADNPTQKTNQVEPKNEVLNNNVALYRSQNVVASGTNGSQIKVLTMDTNREPDGAAVTNGVEDNQNISNKVSANQDYTGKTTPKGAEKEEAALNLLSLANLAFNR